MSSRRHDALKLIYCIIIERTQDYPTYTNIGYKITETREREKNIIVIAKLYGGFIEQLLYVIHGGMI